MSGADAALMGSISTHRETRALGFPGSPSEGEESRDPRDAQAPGLKAQTVLAIRVSGPALPMGSRGGKETHGPRELGVPLFLSEALGCLGRKGDKGPPGLDGIPGIKGEAGRNHILRTA